MDIRVNSDLNWREELAATIRFGIEAGSTGKKAGALLRDALPDFAKELETHRKAVQIRTTLQGFELSVVGSRGLEIEVAMKTEPHETLWVFSRGVVVANLPLAAIPLKDKADALVVLVFFYKAATAEKRLGDRLRS